MPKLRKASGFEAKLRLILNQHPGDYDRADAIKQLIQREIIGDDEPVAKIIGRRLFIYKYRSVERNKLRAEQRDRLEQIDETH